MGEESADSQSPQILPIEEGTIVAGRFQVHQLLDGDPAATMYLGTDIEADEGQVLIRTLPAAIAEDLKAVDRLKLRSLEIISLAHPNIIRLYMVQETANGVVMVTDHVEGTPLAELLDEEGTLDDEDVVTLLMPVAEALDFAHEQGMFHGSVTPANILISPSGTPYLTDFALAREIQDLLGRLSPSPRRRAQPWFAPEQLAGKAPSRAQDVYGLAATLYQCLVGRPPFDPTPGLQEHILRKKPQLPDSEGSRLQQFILLGLAKEPADRPDSCATLLGAVPDRVEATPHVPIKPLPADSDLGGDVAVQAPPSPLQDRDDPFTDRGAATADNVAGDDILDGGLIASEAAQALQHANEQRELTEARPEPLVTAKAIWITAISLAGVMALAAVIGVWIYYGQSRATASPDAAGRPKISQNRRSVGAGRRDQRPRTPANTPTRTVGSPVPRRRDPPPPRPATGTRQIDTTVLPNVPADGFDLAVEPPPSVEKPVQPPRQERLTNSMGMTIVRINPGEFDMGSPEFEVQRRSDEVSHHVTITKAFMISIHEVTRGQFAAFVEETGHKSQAEQSVATKVQGLGLEPPPRPTWRNPGFTQTDKHPVVCVSWNDAQAFCHWLGRKDGRAYRLPTEAEWEYACRAGSSTAFHYDDHTTDLYKFANFNEKSKKNPFPPGMYGDGYGTTSPVGMFRSNAWGLFGMHGNVREWCGDWYKYYQREDQTDPMGPQVGTQRVIRGGSWSDSAYGSRSARRNRSGPNRSGPHIGFRVAADIDEPSHQ